jgi:hypothetical protein
VAFIKDIFLLLNVLLLDLAFPLDLGLSFQFPGVNLLDVSAGLVCPLVDVVFFEGLFDSIDIVGEDVGLKIERRIAIGLVQGLHSQEHFVGEGLKIKHHLVKQLLGLLVHVLLEENHFGVGLLVRGV